MAPDAPAPTYNSHGNAVRPWLVVLRYDDARDVLTMSWTVDGDAWHRQQQGAQAWPSSEVEALVEAAEVKIRSLAAPRLF
jgi:hypothetical protein